MGLETYYKDHWLEIEPERFERYQRFFKASPHDRVLLDTARLAPGQVAADFGCGPGFLAVQMAERLGPDGRVHAFDINRGFVEAAGRNAAEAGLGGRVLPGLLTGETLPLPDDALDRLVARTVLVYVDDPAATLAEFRRVVKPGGLVVAMDSDWGLPVFEPLDPEAVRALLSAASHAFRTPHIGRRLYGLARRAGFAEVSVQVLARPDTEGRLFDVLRNMAGYARLSGAMPEARIDALVAEAEAAVERGEFFALNPQFVVTATV